MGALSIALLATKHHVVSIDISPDACIYSQLNIRSNNFISRIVCADIQNLPFTCNFDLIIASDILYERKMDDILLNCLEKLLTPQTRILIADPCRRGWEFFKKKAINRGFSVNVVVSELSKDGKIRVEIVELRKTAITNQ